MPFPGDTGTESGGGRSNPAITVAADQAEQPTRRRRARVLGDRGADEPGAAMDLEAANVGTSRKRRLIAPEPADAFRILQRYRTRKAGTVERQVAVAAHAVEKRGVAELRLVEAGDAVELSAGESRKAPETGAIEAAVVEEHHRREVGGCVERAFDEPGETAEHRAAQRNRSVEGGAGEIEIGQRGGVEIERLVDGDAAQVLDLTAPERLRELCERRIHALPAAPAGGPAKDSANGPIATMSTSSSCGPPADSARAKA